MTQATVVTCNTGFARKAPMISVSAGVPVTDALEHASCILATIVDLAMNIGDDGIRGSEAFAIQYLTEMAKALVDSSAMGCRTYERGRHGQDS